MIGSHKNFSFNLTLIDHAIVNALQEAIEHIMPEIMSDHHLSERNGYGQFRWNPIITQLRDKCQALGVAGIEYLPTRRMENSRIIPSFFWLYFYPNDRGYI